MMTINTPLQLLASISWSYFEIPFIKKLKPTLSVQIYLTQFTLMFLISFAFQHATFIVIFITQLSIHFYTLYIFTYK